jgi:Arc/MetJ-type ribon-helix-helix transcriptional regulator
MQVSLSPEVAKLVETKLQTGLYKSADEVIGEMIARAGADAEGKADAMEEFLQREMDSILLSKDPNYPTVAEIESRIPMRPYRMGVGNLFVGTRPGAKVRKLPHMPANATLTDFFALRFAPANHVLQSAALAQRNGLSEEIVLACLLHDTAQCFMKTDHGYWAAQLFAPYVSEKVAFAVRYHQALRFFPDPEHGYEYPDLYRRLFGEDYVPLPHIRADYEMVRNHPWYFEARMVTVNDLYSFDPNVRVELARFEDILGRHFKQPKEGLGNDGSPVAHMWRTIANPDTPL